MAKKIRTFLFGPPKDVHDQQTFHSISLVAMLAWVGLGRRRAVVLGVRPGRGVPRARHRRARLHVARGRPRRSGRRSPSSSSRTRTRGSSSTFRRAAAATSSRRSSSARASACVSGCALLVDYVLTITTSIASGGDAIFSMVPRAVVRRRGARASPRTTSARGSIRCSARRSASRSRPSSSSRS